MSLDFLEWTLGIRKVSNEAALLSKNKILERVFFLCRALILSSLPLWIQNPSKIMGIRANRAAVLNLLPMLLRVPSIGMRTKGHSCGRAVEPLIPYQQSI